MSAYGESARDDDLDDLLTLVEEHPDSIDAPFMLGLAYAKIGEYVDAAAAFARTLERCPHHGSAMAELGHALLFSGNTKGSIKALRQAIALVPVDDYIPRFWLATAHIKLGEYADALSQLHDILKVSPQCSWTHRLLFELSMNRRIEMPRLENSIYPREYFILGYANRLGVELRCRAAIFESDHCGTTVVLLPLESSNNARVRDPGSACMEVRSLFGLVRDDTTWLEIEHHQALGPHAKDLELIDDVVYILKKSHLRDVYAKGSHISWETFERMTQFRMYWRACHFA